MNAPVPANEKRRLEVLWKYDVLDTPAEKPLDELAELAAFICQTPIALISLVDEKRQWFKAKIGIDVAETPRNISFCAHAIMNKEVMVVPDATKDSRFASSPLVTDKPNIRFYAGAPLMAPDGVALGTLCVIDHVPREISSGQIEALRKLASVVTHCLEIRHKLREINQVPIHRR